MHLNLDTQRIKDERSKRAWSQSQLAEASGVSLRTVQRIEKTGVASLESVKAFASVYCLEITDIQVREVVDAAPLERQKQLSLVDLVAEARTVVATTFLFLSPWVLFFLWTGLLNWLHDFRDSIFSVNLPASLKVVMSSAIAMILVLLASIVIGLCVYSFRSNTMRTYLYQLKRFNLSTFTKVFVSGRKAVANFFNFMKKPIKLSSILLVLALIVIWLDMEDYQKQTLTRFVESLF